ncbi:hypothetical protein MNBD_GAMMA22-901 [hydrothermal vent metagenome]|uniref:Phosphohistidine phosphatase SixA n=1 Tax=hydrothermal vent metagenome TaxID=652676 RepID=A0A3B1A9T6_9ZZZZ
MKIYLTRHGEAATADSDSKRPLSKKGFDDIHRVAIFNKSSGNKVSYVLHSKKLRAQQTAEILASKMLEGDNIELCNDINPNDPLEPLLQIITDLHQDTLIVGHLPYMSYLVARLTDSPESINKITFTPGTMVCLELAENQHGPWRLFSVIQPETIN